MSIFRDIIVTLVPYIKLGARSENVLLALRIHAMFEAKKQQNLQLLDILACNSADKASRPILKRWYDNRVINQNIQNSYICLMHSTYPS